MRRINVIQLCSVLSVFINGQVTSQEIPGPIEVEARKWSRDKQRNIVYSDWMPFRTQTVAGLPFRVNPDARTPVTGASSVIRFKATGYFRTETRDGRHWLVDPEGNAFLAAALNSVRREASPQQKKSYAEKFGDELKWMASVRDIMDQSGLNMLGSWSDTAVIRRFNRRFPERAIPYSTQLSMLAGYAQSARKKDSLKREWPVPAFIFDAEFPAFCRERAVSQLTGSKDDRWLVGHFSDNELPFQTPMLRDLLRIADVRSAAYRTALEWVRKHGIDTAVISTKEEERFAGHVASVYYETVSVAIKTADPHHLYFGSRLHASAKSNPAVLEACARHADVISMNYYGNWAVTEKDANLWKTLNRPFMITEFYTKAEDSGLPNITGAGWLVRTQRDRGRHYQNFCLRLLAISHCVGWHWFRYQDNDPSDPLSDPSNNDSNKGVIDNRYNPYLELTGGMRELNEIRYGLALRFLRDTTGL
jgi:hypothetical protein